MSKVNALVVIRYGFLLGKAEIASKISQCRCNVSVKYYCLDAFLELQNKGVEVVIIRKYPSKRILYVNGKGSKGIAQARLHWQSATMSAATHLRLLL